MCIDGGDDCYSPLAEDELMLGCSDNNCLGDDNDVNHNGGGDADEHHDHGP
jgi:hypothetical protein